MTFSLIIPHHGAPELLQRLLKSIPRRKDLEVIVIEDTDARGAGWARNQGLKTATGDYILFADSDDWFLPCFSDLLDKLSDCTQDIIYFNATSVEEHTGKPSWRTDRLNWIMNQTCEKREFLLRHTFTEPWCHIIKKSLIDFNSLCFDETLILNDVTFTTQAGYHANTILALDDKAYCVCNRKNSTAKRKDDNKLLTYTKVMAKANAFNRSHGINYYHARMMRPLIASIIHGRWNIAKGCWKEMRASNFSPIRILWQIIIYPFYLILWAISKYKYKLNR